MLKLLTTGMGEAISDFMGQHSVPVAGAGGIFGLAFALWLQFRSPEYRAAVYWFRGDDGGGQRGHPLHPLDQHPSARGLLLDPRAGGLGWGDGTVSAMALVAFVALVGYVVVTKRDVQRRPHLHLPQPWPERPEGGVV